MLRMRIAFSDFLSGLVLNDFLEWVFQEVRFCVARIFLFLNPRWVSLACLKRFWAISPISRLERAGQPFSVVAAWRPFKRAKPAAWDPPSQISDLGVF